jgi:plasmid stabilization system protein ParE
VKRLAVILAPDVRAEINEQVLYIAADSVDNALAWEDRLMKAIHDLQDFYGYAMDEEASSQLGHPVRKLVFEGTYLTTTTFAKQTASWT